MKTKINLIKYFLILVFLGIKAEGFTQQKDSLNQLPFKISELKKLAPEELENKKQDMFVTGIPNISSDPINGVGYGVKGSLIFNGKKSNPFFDYTPYLAKLDIALFNTSKDERDAILTFDKPYVFNTKWRLRGELAYESNPNLLFFGLTDKTLNSLSQLAISDGTPTPPTTVNYQDYENSLTANYADYNTYTKQEYILNISGEYSLLDSRMRILIGGEIAGLNLTTTSNDFSRLQLEKTNSNLLGMGKSTIVFLQAGIVYDTRDFESDPNKGIFAEITNELSNSIFGSNYNTNKTFIQIKKYKKLFPKIFKKVIFASRFGIGYTFGNAPFFEYQDEWSSEGSIEGLGGAHTLRGYKQSRFLGRGMYFANFELRTRFLQFDVLNQNIGLSVVPFMDGGSVYNKASDITTVNRIRYSEGLGLRIAWNLSTILRFDYAISKEDKQFFFIFGHTF